MNFWLLVGKEPLGEPATKLTRGVRWVGGWYTTTTTTMPAINTVSASTSASSKKTKVAATTVAAMPTTELQLRTEFILDRMKFLDNVSEAVNCEEQVGASQFLRLLVENNYPAVITRLLTDSNLKARDAAIWALANLLGADTKNVREAANVACAEVENKVFDNLIGAPSDDIQRSVAYLLYNWAREFGDNEDVDETLLRLLENGFVRGVKKMGVRVDLLHAVRAALGRTRAGEKAAREIVNLLAAAPASKKEMAVLLDAFGEICSEEESSAFAAEDQPAVFDLFEQLFQSELMGGQRREVTWALSNFICDGDLADKFFTRWELRKDMTFQCEDVDMCLREEACWVLVNAIARARWESTRMDISTDYGLRYALCAVETTCKKGSILYKAVHEALDKLSEWEALYTSLEESDGETEIAEEEGAGMVSAWEQEEEELLEYIPEDVSGETILPAVNAADHAMFAPFFGAAAAPCVATETPLPSAIEMLVDPSHRNGSAALRGLVHALKLAGPNAWVPVPAGTMLSIEDLTLMGSLGYMISQGHFGINPFMTSMRYF
jgi:hypothetical protein